LERDQLNTGEQPGWRQLAEVRPSVRKDSNTVGV
jgi:hypothetical protein